jgi:hypothetical protein
LVFTIEKVYRKWWISPFVGDPEIDLSQIDQNASYPIYPEEVRSTVYKFGDFDYRKKCSQIPTVD